MVEILVSLLVLAIFLWVLSMILDMIIPQFGLPAQVKPIVMGIIGLIAVIYLLRRVGLLGGYF